MLQKIEKFAFSKTLIKDISIPSTVNDLEENWCDSETKITNIEINEKIQSIQNTGDSNTNSIHNIIFSFDKESTLCKKDILRYSKKDGQFSYTVLKSQTQHQQIEIIPKNKNKFSFIDFVQFAYATYPDFITFQPEKSK